MCYFNIKKDTMNEAVKDEEPPTSGGEDHVPDEIEVIDLTDFCDDCERDPCVLVELQEVLSSILDSYRDEKTNRQIRFMMYQDAIRFIYGSGLCRYNRKRAPACVERRIRSMLPDVTYTGFKEADINEE